jgi:hypothetical protein
MTNFGYLCAAVVLAELAVFAWISGLLRPLGGW